MRFLLIIPLGLLAACDARSVPSPEAPGTLFTVEGRVVNDRGDGLANVWLMLVDGSRLSGYVDKRGCGTYHPTKSLETDADGRFSVTLPFQPTDVQVQGTAAWNVFDVRFQRVEPGVPIVIHARFVPHHEVRGLVLDEEGRPIPEARIEAVGARTDADGRFTAELADDGPTETRVRRMGYRPLVVPFSEVDRIVLPRRPMVRVTLLRADSGAPLLEPRQVSLWKGDERLSFCTAGDPAMTHEPAPGECSLDAEVGAVELRVDNEPVQTLRVTAAPQSVRLKVAPRPPPPPLAPGDNGY